MYSILNTKCMSNENNNNSLHYIINLSLNCASTQLAVNLSNEMIAICDSSTLKTISCVKHLENLNPEIKYYSDNELMVSTNDSVYIFDTRLDTIEKFAKRFEINYERKSGNNTNGNNNDLNHISCFDINCDHKYLVCGTECCADSNTYLLFWDIRKADSILGSYCESHTDDITDVRFHPNKNHILCSGGCDQLINIFDINQSEEDDALQSTFNTESGIQSIYWITDNDLICLTGDETIQLYDTINDVKCKVQLTPQNCDFFQYSIASCSDKLIAVGNSMNSILLLDVYSDSDSMVKHTLSNGHNSTVRSVCFTRDGALIYSGGEDGIICMWSRDSHENSDRKIVSKTKRKRLTPY